MLKNAVYKRDRKLNVTGRRSWQQKHVPDCDSPKSIAKQKGAISQRFLIPFLIFIFSFLILSGCGFDVEDPTPPDPPQWVPKSLPEEWPERGIDAHESGGIFLEWEIESCEGIIGHRIYRAIVDTSKEDLVGYTQIHFIECDTRYNGSYIDIDVIPGNYYSYYLRTVSGDNSASMASDTLTYSLHSKPIFSTMTPSSITDTITYQDPLSWNYYYNNDVEVYHLTLVSSDGVLIIRDVFPPGNYLGRTERWTLSDDLNLIDGYIYQWRIDPSSNYNNDRETRGSESDWAKFVFKKG